MEEIRVPTDCPDIRPHYKAITWGDFLNKCTACGGNWSAMLMSGIREVYPDYYKAMPERAYDFGELFDICAALGVYKE